MMDSHGILWDNWILWDGWNSQKIHQFTKTTFENKDQGPQRIALNNNFNLEISLLFY